jgi:drug/metabolite transporter (DMT)-like permease
MTRRGWILFFALGVIWGLPYLLIRVSVREVSPPLLVFVRTAGGAILLLPFVARRERIAQLLAHWRPLLAYTVIEIGVPWFLLFDAEKRLSSSLAGLLIATVPIFGAVLAQATKTDKLDRRRVSGLALGICGVAALVGFDVHGSNLIAALSLAVVSFGYALGPWVLARHLSDLPGISVVAGSLVLCAVAYAPIALTDLPTRKLSSSVVASMVTLTVLCTAIAFVVFMSLIKEVGAMRTTVITYVNPAVAVLLGVSVLGEQFGLSTAIGFVLILAGSFLATRPLRERSPVRGARAGGAADTVARSGTAEAPVVAEP